MDFTHAAYERILRTVLEAGYHILPVREALAGTEQRPIFILRHDVEWILHRTRAVTEIEKKLGLRSSLYFRVDTKVYDVAEMRRLESEGFEIGYHYNTLDRCGGDFTKAIALFEKELKQVRQAGLNIVTVIPHGDPRVKKTGYRTNGDIIERDPGLYERNGLKDIAAGLHSLYPPFEYISDVGIRWKTIGATTELIDRLRQREWPIVYMLTHPDYWSNSPIRAAGLQVAARPLRAFRINRIIAALRAIRTGPRRHGSL